MNVDRDRLLDNDALSEIRLHDNGDVPYQIGSTALGRHSGSHTDVPALSQPLPPGHHELRESASSNGSSSSSSSTNSPALGSALPSSAALGSPMAPMSSSNSSSGSTTSSSQQPTHWMREQWEINYKEAAIFLEVRKFRVLGLLGSNYIYHAPVP